MRRLTLLSAVAIVPALLVGAGPDRDARAEEADSTSAALQAELDALFRELGGTEVPLVEPGEAPDLVIASTRSVLGELAPCG